MPIYINKNGQQSGPYEDHVVLDQLRSALLSPNDMAIRQGDAGWQKLGDMFPGVVPDEPASPRFGTAAPAVASVVGNTASASPTPKKGGGCLKAGLIGTGLLFLFLGICVAIGGRFIPSVSCDLAESDHHKIEKLQADLDKATHEGKFDKIGPLQRELTQELSGAEASERYCEDDKFRNNVITGGGVVMGIIGLLMAVTGLIVGRRK
ncbi:MAG: DUF4339 domain-containing protein [Pyrinomonadaceae bacterium]